MMEQWIEMRKGANHERWCRKRARDVDELIDEMVCSALIVM